MTQEHTDDTDAPRTLGEISHTHPHTGNAFGDTMTFERGTTVAADGGERGSPAPEDDEPDESADGDRLRDVDHTPLEESDGANSVYERGHEGRERGEDE